MWHTIIIGVCHVAGVYGHLYWHCNSIAIVTTFQYYQFDFNRSNTNIIDDNKYMVMKSAERIKNSRCTVRMCLFTIVIADISKRNKTAF